jgi:hypothetical protein
MSKPNRGICYVFQGQIICMMCSLAGFCAEAWELHDICAFQGHDSGWWVHHSWVCQQYQSSMNGSPNTENAIGGLPTLLHIGKGIWDVWRIWENYTDQELSMLLQSKMIEEWSRENAMIKVSVLCYIHFFKESIAGWNPIDEVHCMSIEGEVGRSTHKLRVHIRLINRFPL